MYYKPYVETRVIAKYNVTDTSSPTTLLSSEDTFKSIEIDGVMLDELVTEYTFETTGEHTVKYELYDAELGEGAFDRCSELTSITIPDSVTSIGDGAFSLCRNLTSITIGNGVTSIGDCVFEDCNSLTNITIPDSVTSIGNSAFNYCSSLISVTIGSGVTSIGDGVFESCSGLTSITIPDSVTSIGYGIFMACSGLISVTIGSGVTSIGGGAFQNCSGLISITSNAMIAPTIDDDYVFMNVKTGGTLTVPSGSSGYDVWMGTGDYYLGKYGWTKVEQ